MCCRSIVYALPFNICEKVRAESLFRQCVVLSPGEAGGETGIGEGVGGLIERGMGFEDVGNGLGMYGVGFGDLSDLLQFFLDLFEVTEIVSWHILAFYKVFYVSPKLARRTYSS